MSDFLMKVEKLMRGVVPEATPYIDVERKKEVWKRITLENNGTFKIRRTVDRTLSRLIMEIPVHNLKITFEESDNNHLRIRCNINQKDFKFYITFEDLIERIIKAFRNREIEIGDKEFDEKYLIVTNNEKKMTEILSDKKLKTLLIKNNVSNFHLDNGELFILGHRHIDKFEELNEMLEIMKIVINKISR